MPQFSITFLIISKVTETTHIVLFFPVDFLSENLTQLSSNLTDILAILRKALKYFKKGFYVTV